MDYSRVPVEEINCDQCGLEASIFQVEGDYCLQCGQIATEPNITLKID
jgi:hypothetical protein